MTTFMNSILNAIYTFFTYFYTLFSFSKRRPRSGTLTPFPADLESGPEHREHKQVSFAQPPCSASKAPSSNPNVPEHRCFSPSLVDEYDSSLAQPAIISQMPQSDPPPTAPPQMPLPPLQQFVFPAYPSFRSNTSSHSIHSVVASPMSVLVERPGSARSLNSASSANSDVRSQLSSYALSTPPPTKKKTHKKQSPIVWFKDASRSAVAASGSMSSLGSLQSAGSSVSIPSLHRHRSARPNSWQGMKRDPSLSYKRFTARSSKAVRQSKIAGSSRPISEDPVSMVRKVFVECGSEVEFEGGGARARLMNRDTARSFGGMEIVNEEEEEDDELFRSRPRITDQSHDHTDPSSCSTPESAGPVTPRTVSCFSPAEPEVAIVSPSSYRVEPEQFLLPASKSTQLPYLHNRASAVLSSLGISLPSSGSFSYTDKYQNRRLTARLSTMCPDQRVSVVTWSDLVSFSSYGLDSMDGDIEQGEPGGKVPMVQAHAQESVQESSNGVTESKVVIQVQNERPDQESEESNFEEPSLYSEYDTVDDSGVDLAAVLDSMSILVGHGLDARLLLSPPRQFCLSV